MPKFSVRIMELTDIQNIVEYWMSASADDLKRMGADAAKMPSREKFAESLKKIFATPDANKQTGYVMWLVDDKAVGFSSLKNVVFGESGEIHLHMWDASLRGKGYGPILFSLGVQHFYKQFQLKRIKCEPSSTNPLPNKMFAKIGYQLVKTYTAASSELSLVCELNQYNVTLEQTEKFLSTCLN